MLQNIKVRKTGPRMEKAIDNSIPGLSHSGLSPSLDPEPFKTCYRGMLDWIWDLLSVEDLEGFSQV